MIDLPADIEERAAYPLISADDRWIMNKLEVIERLGYRCGPSGTPITVAGDYILKPIMNSAGRGHGGVLRHRAEATTDPDDGETIVGGITQPPFAAGYFWMEYFDDTVNEHGWTCYTNDLPVDEWSGTRTGRNLPGVWRNTNFQGPAVPAVLQGISTHLLIEWIGSDIIEVAPRHMAYDLGRVPLEMRAHMASPPWGHDDSRWFYWRVRAI